MTDPTLSLVTGTMNRPESYRRMLDSIKEQTTVSWELVVADASGYAEPGYNIIVLRDDPPMGCVKAYNRAFRETRGEWVIWLNDDVEVLSGYDIAAIDFMSRHPEIGIGALYYADKHPPFKVSSLLSMVFANFGILRRQTGESVDWFDDDLTMYGNDNSLTFKILMGGWGVATIPGARLWHHALQDSTRLANQRTRYGDEAILSAKYGPYVEAMRKVYERTAHLVGPLTIDD